MTSPEQIWSSVDAAGYNYFKFTSPNQLILPLTIIFILAALFAAILRLTLLYATTRLSYATGADLSINMYRRTLYQDLSVHLGHNSSEIINGIITKSNLVMNGVLKPVLILISSIFFVISIILSLFLINIGVAFSASIGFGLLYFIVIRYTRQLKENSKCIAEQSTLMIKTLQEGLGGIRDVLIDGSQMFCNLYRKADLPLRRQLEITIL